MKKSELKNIIRESVKKLMNEEKAFPVGRCQSMGGGCYKRGDLCMQDSDCYDSRGTRGDGCRCNLKKKTN